MQSSIVEGKRIEDTEKSNANLVVGFYEEASTRVRGDLVADDFTGRAPGTTFNHDSFIKSLEQFTRAFSEGRYVNEDTITEGDKVVTIGTFHGIHTGEFQGIPPTGKRVSVMVVHVDRVRDGKIVEHLRLSDTAGLIKQLAPTAPRLE
jgi:predicted ester cyclase